MPLLELYSTRKNIVPPKSGLNWCFANAHVNTCDAYIALRSRFFRANPDFFPEHGNLIDTVWDDGMQITCLLEGTQTIDGITYPKQISSYNDKSVIGSYLRDRLQVSSTHVITMDDLHNFGKNYVEVTHISGNQYFFDLS